MFFAPLTCCSIGEAMDWTTASALAPGKLAVTSTWGGTICGNCVIGKPSAATAPARVMISEMTVEKTGRSMTKLNTAHRSRSVSAVILAAGDRDGFHREARPDLRDAFDDHQFPRIEPPFDE